MRNGSCSDMCIRGSVLASKGFRALSVSFTLSLSLSLSLSVSFTLFYSLSLSLSVSLSCLCSSNNPSHLLQRNWSLPHFLFQQGKGPADPSTPRPFKLCHI